ncbi:MAG TPA: hypothetical protein VFX64_06420 [Candidatus Nitrosotalea sp.]|nr:hypothetical protein [Candidatus Nitrosotalea sp.]
MKVLLVSMIAITLTIMAHGTGMAFGQDTNSTMPQNAIRTPDGGWVTPPQTYDDNGKNLTIHYETGIPVQGNYLSPGPPPVMHIDIKPNSQVYQKGDWVTISGQEDSYLMQKYANNLTLTIDDTRTKEHWCCDSFQSSNQGTFYYSFKMPDIFQNPDNYNLSISPGNSTDKYGTGILYYATLPDPLVQFKMGISALDVECRDNLVHVIKSEDKSPACVKQGDVDELASRGWSEPGIIPSKRIPHIVPPSFDSKPDLVESYDIFGIREIYPTKQGSPQWFMNQDDITNDMLFYSIPYSNSSCASPCASFYKNADDSWHVTRMDVPENEGIRLVVNAPPNTLWLNTEMTGYYKLENSTHYPQEFTHVTRSGTPHTAACTGYSYYLSITYDGSTTEAQKALYHSGDATSYSETFTGHDITTPLENRWIGMKTMTYNINSTAVRFEIWIDDKDDNNWKNVFNQTDTGWPVPGNPAGYGCKNISTGLPMKNNDIISWGGTEQQFRADDAAIDFKNLSIREIVPPT